MPLKACKFCIYIITHKSQTECNTTLVIPTKAGREIKRSLSPKLERGFHAACTDLAPKRKFVVYPGVERYRLAADIEAISLEDMAMELVAI